MPSSTLNVPFFNPNHEDAASKDEDEHNPVKFNSKVTQKNSLVMAMLKQQREKLKTNEDSIKPSPNELSAESRKKIDEVKAKIEALNKKYAPENSNFK